jgi:hypothetical protein
MPETPSDALAYDPDFQKWLGAFQFIWSSLDLTTDYAIFKFLKVTAEQAHLIVAGMFFGRKAKLLADLIKRSEHPNRENILRTFNEVHNSVDREWIIHSYIESERDHVTFITKKISGSYKAKSKTFTKSEFEKYVTNLTLKGDAFHRALAVDEKEFNDFADAALRA